MSVDPSRRVLCLTSWYPPHHFGGYELSCRDVMDGLRARGHDVHVLTSDHRHDDVPDADETSVHRLLRLYFRDGDLWTPPVLGRVTVERHNRQALLQTLDLVRPDVVSVWHVGAMSLGLLAVLVERDIPITFAVSDDWPIYAPRLDPWTRAALNRPRISRILGRVTGIPTGLPPIGDAGPFCFISELTRQRVERSSPWSLARTGIVYSGIDHGLFAAEPEVENDVVDSPATILYVGRVDERKGIRTLVRALAQLDGAGLIVDGRSTPQDADQVRRWAEEVGVADRVTLQCSTRDDLPVVYRSATVCVFPSEWEEPFGLVPLEAMAAGTPVVASGVGGSGEFLVDGHNCVLFEPGDPQTLAEGVRRVLDDRTLRHGIVSRGRATAAFFDVEHLTDSFEQWHEFAITGGTPPPDRVPPAQTESRPTRHP